LPAQRPEAAAMTRLGGKTIAEIVFHPTVLPREVRR
jgi:hypothetical protein